MKDKNKSQIIIIGGGSHAKVLINLIQQANDYEIVGILDVNYPHLSTVMNCKVLGRDDKMIELFKKGIQYACIGIGGILDSSPRKIIFAKLKDIGFSIPQLIHPKAIIANNVIIQQGAQIMAGAIIQPETIINKNVIINTGAIIEHDCIINENSHIAPGVTICGNSVVGSDSFIGAGATIINNIKIGDSCIIGSGALVINNVENGQKVKGVPAK